VGLRERGRRERERVESGTGTGRRGFGLGLVGFAFAARCHISPTSQCGEGESARESGQRPRRVGGLGIRPRLPLLLPFVALVLVTPRRIALCTCQHIRCRCGVSMVYFASGLPTASANNAINEYATLLPGWILSPLFTRKGRGGRSEDAAMVLQCCCWLCAGGADAVAR